MALASHHAGFALFQQGAFHQALAEMRLASTRGGVSGALNRLWLEVVESDFVGLSSEVLDAASDVEALAKIECLESLNGTAVVGNKNPLETMTLTIGGRGDDDEEERSFWARAEATEDLVWRVESSPRESDSPAAAAIAHMDLGRELCDFHGDRYVDLVKRSVTGYDATRPFDIDFERVSS